MILEGRNINSAGQPLAQSGDVGRSCLGCFPKESKRKMAYQRETGGAAEMHSAGLSMGTAPLGLYLACVYLVCSERVRL